MLRILRSRKGQNTAEYAILIALVVAAAVAMQTYVKRGAQARVKDSADDYIKSVTTDPEWANITSTRPVAAARGQYEVQKLSRQSTQDTIKDTSTTHMTTGGAASREFERTTQQATGDYQQYDY